MTIDAFARALRAGRISSAELVSDCLRRIDADDPRLNAFILVTREEALKAAAGADRELAEGLDRGPLHGVPISVKDLFDVRGTATTAASRVREGHVAATDAGAIARLRQAGAVIIGKTNLHEFAFGTTNEDSAFGPVHHPLDSRRSPGGSSGGSAVSVATGMALATLGTDTGGSIRIPAAACGTVGLKPTYGEVPADGVVPLSPTLDHVGPLTATVTDAWHVLHALRGANVPRALEPSAVSSMRLAVPRAYFCDLLDDAVREQFEAALSTLRLAGAAVEDVTIPSAQFIASIYLAIVFGDAAAYHGATLDVMPERYTLAVRLRLELARYLPADAYVEALHGRARLRHEVDHALHGCDALVLPTLPIPAPLLGEPVVTISGTPEPVRNVMLRLTQLFNLTGHPAISLPIGRTPEGLPCGLQLVGVRGQTDALLHVARSLETVLTPRG